MILEKTPSTTRAVAKTKGEGERTLSCARVMAAHHLPLPNALDLFLRKDARRRRERVLPDDLFCPVALLLPAFAQEPDEQHESSQEDEQRPRSEQPTTDPRRYRNRQANLSARVRERQGDEEERVRVGPFAVERELFVQGGRAVVERQGRPSSLVMMEAVGRPTKQVRHLGRVGREVGASLQLDRVLGKVESSGCAMDEL